MTGLRSEIVAMGGADNSKFRAINGIAALMHAAGMRELAQRADVWRIAPNRTVASADSMLEMVTGAAEVHAIGGAGALDGTGVGIAVLDSGVMSTHLGMLGSD